MKRYIEYEMSKEDAEKYWVEPPIFRMKLPEYVKNIIIILDDHGIQTKKNIFIN